MANLVGDVTPDLNGVDSRRLAELGRILRRGMPGGDPAVASALQVFSGESRTRPELLIAFSAEQVQLLENLRLLEVHADKYHSPFRPHLVLGNVILTDPVVSWDRQAASYVDPLWEAPYLSKMLARGDARSALDVGCGSGVLSLELASFVPAVVGIDLNPRAVALSRLNAGLNEITGVSFLEGDLFEPVRGRRFDRIVFNSPTDQEGTAQLGLLLAGEGILEQFFQRVGEQLTPAGIVQVNLGIFERAEESFAGKLSHWLKPDAAGWQSLFLLLKQQTFDDGRTWKRGWLTLRRGRPCFAEVPIRYSRLLAEATPEAGWQLVGNLLEEHCGPVA